MINVTKTFLPSFEDYTSILKRAWDNAWITNNGELVQELEQKLKDYLSVKHLLFTTNGTVVLQMALKAMNITKEVITTPFSYVATANAIVWEGCTPVFVDIDPDSYCIDSNKIEEAITADTEAILATHVFGIPCDVIKIESIAKKHNLKLIYDGAHAFGTNLNGKSLLSYGDISTCSFHATKVFHTVEGGCIICNDEELLKNLRLFRSFGHIGDDYYSVGINAKNSEFHAAMGLANLPYLSKIIEKRKDIFELYHSLLTGHLKLFNQHIPGVEYNYCYYPVVVESEDLLLQIKDHLAANGINVRRYFYPSLNNLNYLKEYSSCPVSEDISSRILCLPLYESLSTADVEKISSLIINKIATARLSYVD